MKNITITPAWQLTLSAVLSADCATSALAAVPASALAAVPAQGIAVRPATDITAIKRERANAGMGSHGFAAVCVPGPLAWSPPI